VLLEETLGDRKDNHTSHVRRLEDMSRRTKTIHLKWMSASASTLASRRPSKESTVKVMCGWPYFSRSSYHKVRKCETQMLDVLLTLSKRSAKNFNGSGRAETCENVAKTSVVCKRLGGRYQKRNNCNIMCI
jgi:hypothetical protein